MKKKASFEDMKKELEQIVEVLDEPCHSYEKSQELYERGELLSSELQKILEKDWNVVSKKESIE